MRALRLLVIVFSISLAAAILNFLRLDPETLEWSTELEIKAPGAFIKTELGVTHYELEGTDQHKTVVLVPGYSVPYYVWDPTFLYLRSQGFRVLRYDLFGRGLSERPFVTYNGATYQRQLLEMLDGLDIKAPIHLIAASASGPFSADFACRNPRRIQDVVFIDPAFTHGAVVPLSLRLPGIGEYLMTTRFMPELPRSQTDDFRHPERFPDWEAHFRPQMQIKGFRRALLSTRRTYFTEEWSRGYACLGARRVSALVIWGVNDKAVPFSISRDLLNVVPQAQFLAVDDAGHLPMLEHPEIVNSALASFLNRQSTSSR